MQESFQAEEPQKSPQLSEAISEQTSLEIQQEALIKEAQEKIGKSQRAIGEHDFQYFVEFFSMPDPKSNPIDFVEGVKELQQTLGVKSDGILGPITLEKIYLQNYLEYQNNQELLGTQADFPIEVQSRLDAYKDLGGYREKPGALYHKLNVFSNQLFFGRGLKENTQGTYINEELAGEIPETLDASQPANLIRAIQIGGRKAVAFYIDHQLHVATFVSPGLQNHKTISRIGTGSRNPDMLHTSSKYPEASRDSEKDPGGAVMPYAVHIAGGYRMHGTDSRVDGTPASHGCMRVPLFYMQEIHKQVQELGVQNVTIDTRDLYN